MFSPKQSAPSDERQESATAEINFALSELKALRMALTKCYDETTRLICLSNDAFHSGSRMFEDCLWPWIACHLYQQTKCCDPHNLSASDREDGLHC